MAAYVAGKADKVLPVLEDDALVLLGRYRQCLRTTNMVERLNEEIRRRDRVPRIFSNEASALCLVGTGGVHEKRIGGYVAMEGY